MVESWWVSVESLEWITADCVEIYLRRPPSKNEQYRLDRMLIAAAERGVKVNVIVYKEVSQILTRKYSHFQILYPRYSLVVTSI